MDNKVKIIEGKILELKLKLFETDYIDHKLLKAVINYIVTYDNTELINLCEEYKVEIQQRQEWRDEINALEKELSMEL